jgi:hypothetical protein
MSITLPAGHGADTLRPPATGGNPPHSRPLAEETNSEKRADRAVAFLDRHATNIAAAYLAGAAR